MRRSKRMKRVLREHISTLALILTTFLALRTSAASRTEAEAAEAHAKTQRVQDVIDDLRGRLSLRRDVVATLVPANPLMVSVRSPVEHGGAYQVAFEGSFVDTLSDDELRAVIAHELGHVWIFTHHPYLQTEQLANKVALRVVPRESLKRVYAKVWPHGAPSGAPVRFPVVSLRRRVHRRQPLDAAISGHGTPQRHHGSERSRTHDDRDGLAGIPRKQNEGRAAAGLSRTQLHLRIRKYRLEEAASA